ncbi:hypothetical protein FGG08_003033 [Glutinoglossum americanum]|uniref:Uncharacterized protein n=1 Tax=Glutinoglossum americanum TaxID=1670608 RepID=A0A9P8IE54_9PEZI|nr:hypothetical protein FGG08_003033 [Glutinoglossum americanum]
MVQNTTVPSHPTQSHRTGWVSNPSHRGTLNILESCLFTIVLCTWSVLHLNVPAPNDGSVAKLLRKVKWMAITVAFPEFILALALSQLGSAWEVLDTFKKAGLPVHRAFHDRGRWGVSKGASSGSNCRLEEEWTLTHIFFVNMGGVRVRREGGDRSGSGADYSILVTASQLVQWKDEGWYAMQIFPLADIKDKSKVDIFTKALTVMQILWLVISVIARSAYHLPCSQLEILTLAFAACAVPTYATLWFKPKDVETPMYIGASAHSYDALRSALRDSSVSNSFISDTLAIRPTHSYGASGDRIPNDSYRRLEEASVQSVTTWLAIATLVFGSIHVAAWNFDFPTPVERMLWRVCSILSSTIPSVLFVIDALNAKLQVLRDRGIEEDPDPDDDFGAVIYRADCLTTLLFDCCGSIIHSLLVLAFTTIYMVSRLIIIALALTSLRSMPDGVYKVTWAKNIPNVG